MVAIAVLVVIALTSLVLGAQRLSLATVADALLRFDAADNEQVVARLVRLPRTTLGLLVGAALGLAGATVQGLTRNPLAGPGILGISAGASLAVVLAIFLVGVSTVDAYVWFAYGGAAAAGALVYTIGSLGRGGATPVKLALAGAALTALLGSFTSAITLLDHGALEQYRFWVVGSLAPATGDRVVQVLPSLGVGLALALASARGLDALALGDDAARGLGQRLWVTRTLAAGAVVVLTGAATAAAGPIGFVGLVVPHAARIVTGPAHRWLMPYSAVFGAGLLVLADTVGRTAAAPRELQVGIVTALVGAPLFIALVRRRRLAEL